MLLLITTFLSSCSDQSQSVNTNTENSTYVIWEFDGRKFDSRINTYNSSGNAITFRGDSLEIVGLFHKDSFDSLMYLKVNNLNRSSYYYFYSNKIDLQSQIAFDSYIEYWHINTRNSDTNNTGYVYISEFNPNRIKGNFSYKVFSSRSVFSIEEKKIEGNFLYIRK